MSKAARVEIPPKIDFGGKEYCGVAPDCQFLVTTRGEERCRLYGPLETGANEHPICHANCPGPGVKFLIGEGKLERKALARIISSEAMCGCNSHSPCTCCFHAADAVLAHLGGDE